ncbi:hypothetical protein I532_03990 [Brevibacillus borstelensis AK1]|uniref:Uncharacterized protein n=1 Tax=Brevibacillus borstelensis AK1 TaxID=1300222 RepID=M8E654_9BACL|nr:hypothetical protein [Brevibacillus borstelensis]EMT54736.1 hypothetical protein I532_03990 [Brevibacillus borstelensis AK1]
MTKIKRKNNETNTLYFRGHADYKSAFSAAVSELTASNRANPIPRSERMALIEALTDEYVASTGERPDVAELERLADAVLYEELTDSHPDKVTRTEYPIMSEQQLARRQNASAPLHAAHYEGTDGRNYRVPTRRKRSNYENVFVDRAAKIRNAERKRQYARDTRAGEVVTYLVGN